MKKKIMSCVLCLALLINLFPINSAVFAVDAGTATYTIEADKTTAHPGDTITYTIKLQQTGNLVGIEAELDIPEGLEFVAGDNPQWTKVSDRVITTNALANTLLKPGESASVQVTLKWINGDNNFGQKVNVAEISAHKNDSNSPDIDSTPDNNKPGEDDIDDAPVMLEISTGTAPTYIVLTTTVLAILTTGIILIKKYVL